MTNEMEAEPMTNLRPIKPMPMPDVAPAAIDPVPPQVELVDPRTLHVEGDYQRTIAQRSVTLIRNIVREFDWLRFKPPICARNAEGQLCVIDGQHTAIGAASHPAIALIPVLVVDASRLEDRAAAFLGHNRDRVAITQMQLHYAALAAGEDIAVAVDKACRRAGVKILKCPPSAGIFEVGETVAVGTLRKVVARRGHAGGARVLDILVNAGAAPIASIEIHAVAALLWEPEWKDDVSDAALTKVIASRDAKDWRDHAEFKIRKGRNVPLWRALAIAWFQALPKRRKAA